MFIIKKSLKYKEIHTKYKYSINFIYACYVMKKNAFYI